MTLRGILQIALGIALWAGALVALWFGTWIPLAILLVLSLLLVLIIVGPSAWARRSRASKQKGS